MSMASTADSNSRHHHHQQPYQQQQQQQRYGPSSGNGAGQAQTYTLYPDQLQSTPSQRAKQQQQQQRSFGDLTPQSSFSSTSSHHNHSNNNSPVVSRGDSTGSKGMGPQPMPSQLSYLRTPATSGGPGGAPPSPISPSTPVSYSPIEAMTSQMNLTRLEEPVQDRVTIQNYDQSKYQQPRKKPSSPALQQQLPFQQQHQQQRHQQLQEGEGYGAGVLKQSGSSGSARSMGSQGHGGYGGDGSGELKQSASSASSHSLNSMHARDNQSGPLRQSPSSGSAYSPHSSGSNSPRLQQRHVNGELKQSGSSASATSVASSRSQQQQLNPSHSNGSATSSSSKRHQQTSRGASPSPPSPLAYLPDFDDDKEQDREQNHEKHRQQAFQFQQQLQQKPPSANGDDDDSDDSDSSSMLSYRRSISRVSMSFKRTNNGVPNISLFAPGQRPAMLNPSSGYSAGLTESQKMIQEQREERLRQQKLQHQEQGHGPSIDQHTRQEDGRSMMARNQNNNGNHYQGSTRDALIPERSSSADSFTGGNSGSSRSRHPGGNGGRSNPSSPSMANRQLNSAQQQHQPSRPSHESAHSQRLRPDRLNVSQNDYQHDNGNIMGGQRSRSPGPVGPATRSPGSPMPPGSGGGGVYRQNGYPGGPSASSSSLPLASSQRSGPSTPVAGSFSQNGPNLNPHPAHHLASGGYVRPEEAVGPANPMPEKAEDFVRQGIEYHEVGDIAKATHFFRTAAEMGDPVGMLMYGLSVRHGWGCASNRQLAFQYLQKSAEHAVGDLKSRDSFASTAAKGELVLAIYELGICFRHGWGVDKNKKTAAYYFEIAANLGDPDAQNDLAWCFYHGVGVKKDMFKAAKYYRLAAAQGLNTVGNSWIWKDKYGGVPVSPTADKGQSTF